MNEADKPPPVVVQVSETVAADDVPGETSIAAWTRAALNGTGGYVCVRIVDAGEIKTLNNRFRGIDKPTNVLAFPAPAAGEMAVELPGDVDDGFHCTCSVSRSDSDSASAVSGCPNAGSTVCPELT